MSWRAMDFSVSLFLPPGDGPFQGIHFLFSFSIVNDFEDNERASTQPRPSVGSRTELKLIHSIDELSSGLS